MAATAPALSRSSALFTLGKALSRAMPGTAPAPAQPMSRTQRRQLQRRVRRQLSRLAGETKLQRKGRKASIW
jgi:hypothetical protein